MGSDSLIAFYVLRTFSKNLCEVDSETQRHAKARCFNDPPPVTSSNQPLVSGRIKDEHQFPEDTVPRPTRRWTRWGPAAFARPAIDRRTSLSVPQGKNAASLSEKLLNSSYRNFVHIFALMKMEHQLVVKAEAKKIRIEREHAPEFQYDFKQLITLNILAIHYIA